MGKTPYMKFQFEIEDKKVLKFLEQMTDNKKMKPHVKEALNRAGNKFVNTLKSEAYNKYKIKSKSYLNQFIKTKKATNDNLEYKIKIRSSVLNAIRFAQLENRKIYRKTGSVKKVVKSQKVAKSIEIIRGQRIQLKTRGPKTWFVGNKGRTLFSRVKGEKKKIQAVHTVSPTYMLGQKEFLKKANKEAEEVLKKRIEHAIKNFRF